MASGGALHGGRRAFHIPQSLTGPHGYTRRRFDTATSRAMLFKKLLPKEGNFFEMFNQHAERMVDAAHAFSNLVANYSDVNLREQYAREVDHCERAADKVTAVAFLSKLSDHDTAVAALKTCEEIDKLESDADRVMRSAMSKLFREEPDVREVIKLKAIYELLETITDKCEDVANVVEGIVLENS
jgi:uncharacterized protein Yka (UPF0111/DUF47 family)